MSALDQLGPMAGPPPGLMPLPPGMGPGGPGGPDPDEAAEHAVLNALRHWQSLADDPGEHAFVAKLVAQVAQYIAKEQDEVHNAVGLNSVQKSIVRGRV